MFAPSTRPSMRWLLILLCLGLPTLCVGAPPPKNAPPVKGSPGKASPNPPTVPPVVKKVGAQFEKALALHRAKKTAEAIAAYKEFLRLAAEAKLPPVSTLPALQNLAALYQFTANQPEQEKALRQIVKIDPRYAPAYAQLATIAADQRRFDEAKTNASKALALKPSPPIAAQAHFSLGVVAGARDDAATAEKEFGLSVRFAPRNPQAYFNYALVLGKQQKLKPAQAAVEKAIQFAPDMMIARLYRAALKQQAKDYKGALAAYDDVLKRDPKSPVALYYRALMLQQLGRADDAISAYLKTLEVEPNSVAAHINLGQLYYRINNAGAARQHYAAAHRLAPKEPRALSGLALSEFQDSIGLRDPTQRDAGIKQAEAHFKQALALDPKDVATQDGLAYVYEQTRRYDDALALYRKRQIEKPDDAQTYYKIANLYVMQRNVAGVLETWKAYRKRKPDAPDSYIESARILEATAKYEQAAAEWQLLLAKRPKDGNILLSLARDLSLLKRNDAARAHYKSILELDTTGKEAPEKERPLAVAAARALRLDALRGLAALARSENKPEEAIEWLSQAKKLEIAQAARLGSPPNAETYRAIARIYEEAKKPDEAAKELRAWAEAAPQDPLPYGELARLYDRQNKPDEAAAAFRKAAARTKDPVEYRLQIAEMYRRRQKNDLALAEYEDIQKQNPKETRILSAMAQAYELAGKDEKAVAAYDALLKSDPNAHWAKDKQATCFLRLKRYPEARAVYEKEIDRAPENLQTYADLARVYELEGKADAYLPWLQARLVKTPNNLSLMTAVQNEFVRQKREDAGWTYLRDIVEKSQNRRPAQQALATLYVQRGKRADALALYREIADQNPKDVNLHTMLGDQLFAGEPKDKEEAIRRHETLLARDDIKPEEKVALRRQLTGWYQQLGKTTEAIAQSQEILKIRKGDFTASMKLVELYTASNREPEAVTLLADLSKQTDYPPIYRALFLSRIGGIYEKQGRKTDALGQYREALKLDPKNTEAEAALKRLGG